MFLPMHILLSLEPLTRGLMSLRRFIVEPKESQRALYHKPLAPSKGRGRCKYVQPVITIVSDLEHIWPF
jgi:hypothetical protein